MITTEYSAIYLHHCVGMFKSEITTSSSDITPVDTSNLGTYHFIIATEVYNTGTEVTRKVLYSERSGDAHFSYRDPVTGSTVTWEDTVDAGWSGMVNENYEYDAGGDYRIIIQPVYYGFDQGKTPVGNYFFAGSPFTVEYASSILSSVITESTLGGDRDRGYYCNKTWRTNRLSGWRCYQTGNLIGDFPFNTSLNATACGTCFYNIIGEASNASEGSLQGTSLKRVILEANGAIITKVVPIVSNRADGNGDWTLCACSLYAGSTYAKYGLWVIPNPLTIEGPLGDSSETVFWDNSWTFDTTKGFVPELNGPVDGKQVKYINFEALSLLNKYFIFTQQYETIRLSMSEIADIQGKYALAMASSVGEISTSLINVEQSVSGKQDKITSTNKLSSDLISGLGAAAAKAVDTAISANSTSTNLPTSKAVEDRINAHSGIDKVGTITGIKMNNASKGTSGVVDLGTVLTDASKFATSVQGTKADNAMPKSGGAFTGNISVPKTITFADTTNPYIKMTTGGTDFYFQSTSGQFGLGPTWNKATHWDSNGNVTFPTTPKVGSSPLALKSDIPSAVTESTVSGWGFTKNKGTVTSVEVKMNGVSKGTVTSSGTIDLGTVITSHQGIKKLNTDHTTAQAVNASENIESDILTPGNTINLHKIAKTGSYNDLNYKHINFIGGSFVDFETFATDELVTIDPSLFDPAPNEEDIALVPATLNGANPSIVCCSLLGEDLWVIKGVSYAFPSSGGGTTLNKYKVVGRATNNQNTFATLLYKIVTTAKSYRVYDQSSANNRRLAIGYTVAVPYMDDASNPGAIITLYQQKTINVTKFMSLVYNTATQAATFSGTQRTYTIGTGGAVTATETTLKATELQHIVIEYWNETEITA